MLTVISGALAGVFHVLSGPDHLAAIAPMAVAQRSRGWVAGWTWGVGHSSGVVAVAAAAIALRDALPPVEAISVWSERLVGTALIVLGFWALRRSLTLRVAGHVHGAVAHDHMHVQARSRWAQYFGHGHAAFYLGVLHGIAGSSHFLGVVPALALPSSAAALTYIAGFGAGTVIAITAFAAMAGLVGSYAARAHQFIMTTVAVIAIVVGSVWLVM